MKPCLCLLTATLSLQAGYLSAQSLAEVARRERERRENLRKPAIRPTSASGDGGFTDRERERERDRAQPDRTPIPLRQSRGDGATPATNLGQDGLGGQPEAVPASQDEPQVLPLPSELQPAPDRAQARDQSIARGNALMSSAQYVEAARVFRDALDASPNDRDARLGLARVYAMSGNHSAARLEFENLLSSNPSDTDAMVGLAQAYQWAGVAPMAREWYEKALTFDPNLEAAAVGLGYVELWSEPVMAQRRSDDLLRRLPASDNLWRLREDASRARAPRSHVSYDRLLDTNENQVDTVWAETQMGTAGGWTLSLGGAQYVMRFDGDETFGVRGEGTISSGYATVGRPTGPGRRIDFRAGVDYRSDTLGQTDWVPTGGVRWSWGLDRRWSGRVAFDRDSIRYTTQAIDDRIVLNAFNVSVENRVATNWIVRGNVGYWDIEDVRESGNSRVSAEGGLRYRRLLRPNLPFEAGYEFQYFTYAENFGAGFFSPSFYRGHRFNVSMSGGAGPRVDYQFGGSTGLQSFDFVDNELLWSASGMVGLRLGAGYRLELFGFHGDYLALTDFPVTMQQYGVRLRWNGGALR